MIDITERLRALPGMQPEPEPFELWREACGIALAAADEIDRMRLFSSMDDDSVLMLFAETRGNYEGDRAHILRFAKALITNERAAAETMRRVLHEIAEEWAGAECGEPVHAQEAYAIGLARRMYALAVEGLTPNAEVTG